jgi:hypothetical protein
MSAVQYFKAKSDAKKAEANRPAYNIPSGYYKNLQIANQMAIEGTPASVQNAEMSRLNNNSASAYSRIGDLNGGVRGISGVNDVANNGVMQIAAQDDLDKIKGKEMVMSGNNALSDQTALAYQLNTLNPYYENIAARAQRDRQLSEGLDRAGMMVAGSGGGAKSMPQTGYSPTPNYYSKGYNPTGSSPYNAGYDKNFNGVENPQYNEQQAYNSNSFMLNGGAPYGVPYNETNRPPYK